MAQRPTNEDIAALLERIGQLLETRETNPYRVRAYVNGAASVRAADRPLAPLADDPAALTTLPGIGESLASLIAEYVTTGQSALLTELENDETGGAFESVPGIGPALGLRIADTLDISTLEELEQAAHDGRLDTVEGFGPERVRAVQTALAGMLGQTARRRAQERAADMATDNEPPLATLLDVDAEYRRKAAAGELETIAPKRFNPEGQAWLPVLHTRRGEWSFTVLFSNTARAHEAGKTDDWVVVYYKRQGQDTEEQRTVVTASQGPLSGRRVVRGREAETRRHYAEESPD